MENEKENMSRSMGKASQSLERATETMGDTIIAVIDKLAGKQSDVKLKFEELTFDAGVFKATMNGAIVLDIVMAKEAESTM